MMRRFLVRCRESRGQTLVEFALIVPLFVLLMVGIFDAGRAVYVYSTINNAAHEAARLGIVDQNMADVRDLAVDHAVGVGAQPSDVTVRWLSAGYANTAPCNAAPRVGCVVEVEVRHQFIAATPIVGNLMGVVDLRGLARQPIERTYSSP